MNNYADIVKKARKRIAAMTPEEYAAHQAERGREIKELCEWREQRAREQAIAEGRNADAETIEATWRKMRETSPRAGGAGVDRLLGVPTPAEPLVALPADQEPKTEPKAPRVLTPAEAAKAESELVQGQAAEFQSRDFLSRVCGEGSLKPSGKSTRGWYH